MDNYEYIIEMKHITKRFPRIVANDDVSISIKKGEIYALLGENGAGKTTIMSVLFGMYEPDEGEITAFQTYFQLYGDGEYHTWFGTPE